MTSLRKNLVYSSILTTANYIFPFLTFPYISRVLGVTNIGICNFVDSIINYFIMLSMMGIGAVAIREISSKRKDKEALSKSFSSLLVLNGLSTLLFAAVLTCLIFTVPKIYTYKHLMFIGLFKVIFNLFLIEWFYTGMENFKYVTNRSIIIKIIYVASIFIFVRKSDDYTLYYLLTSLMIACNAIINIIYARYYVHFSFHHINLSPYIKPFIIIGLYIILTSMYTTFNITYLGFSCGEKQVGYYTIATKLHTIILSLFSAFTNVMLPRMSATYSCQDKESFKMLLSKSVHVLVIFSVPIITYALIFSQDIIRLIAGNGYEGAIIPMTIIIPLIFIIGYEQIEIIQVLMPLKKDNYIFITACIGAIVGIIANFFLVEKLQSIGSAIVWVISEFTVLIVAQHYVTKATKLHFPLTYLIKNILAALPCSIILVAVKICDLHFILNILIGGVILLTYFGVLFITIFKEPLCIDLVRRFTSIHKK